MKHNGIRVDAVDVPALTPKLGRKPDERLIALDKLAAFEVHSGVFASDREAAKRYLSQYSQREFSPDDWQAKNDKIKRVAARIKRARISTYRTETNT